MYPFFNNMWLTRISFFIGLFLIGLFAYFQMLNVASNLLPQNQPLLSPNGTAVITTRRLANNEQHLFINEGDQHRQLTAMGSNNHSPVWSPDGRMLLFVSDRDGDNEIFLMDATNWQARQLTHNETWEVDPEWTNEGREILFASDRNGRKQMFVLTEGSGIVQLQD